MKAILIFIIPFLQVATLHAAENVIPSDYMVGKWSSGGKAGCSSSQATKVIFHDNHTLEVGQGKTVSTIGYWSVAQDRIILHMLVAPSQTQDAHPFFQQSYHYQYMAPTVLGIKADSIDFTHDIGVGAGKRKTLTRCR